MSTKDPSAKSKPSTKPVSVGSVRIGPGCGLVLIAGPCVIESREHTLRMAEGINKIAQAAGVPLIFKASYDKANRTSLHSYRGPGLQEGLKILAEAKAKVGVPVTSDVHWPEETGAAGEVLDLLQIPAFLCRQTDLLVAAGKTGKPVNVKKGQFMAPQQMGLAVEKVIEAGASGAMLTERGTFFGYGRLVVDMTAIPTMARFRACRVRRNPLLPTARRRRYAIRRATRHGSDACSGGCRRRRSCPISRSPRQSRESQERPCHGLAAGRSAGNCWVLANEHS